MFLFIRFYLAQNIFQTMKCSYSGSFDKFLQSYFRESGEIVAHADRYLQEIDANADTIPLDEMISEKTKNGKTEFVNDGFG